MSECATTKLAALVAALEDTVQAHMSQNDASHDWSHIQRVRNNAHKLARAEGLGAADALMIDLAALLHDVEDWKYVESSKKLRVKVQRSIISHAGAGQQPQHPLPATLRPPMPRLFSSGSTFDWFDRYVDTLCRIY